MGKLFFRRTESEHPAVPYVLEAETENSRYREYFKHNLGEVYVLPMLVDGGFVIGCGQDNRIRIPLGTAQNPGDLTQKVYDCAMQHGKTIANSLPEKLEFIDETGGPRNIEFQTLGCLLSAL